MVFESLVEKLLTTYAGDYIGGIESKNLSIGVLSGKVVVENIFVKPGVLDILGAPVQLKYSTVGKIDLQIPWKSLGSSPVQAQIEKILLVLSPKDPKDWKLPETTSLAFKHEALKAYSKLLVEKYTESLKNMKKDPNQKSFAGLMVEKIIDNLQVTMKDIHIRFESENESFCLGVSLESFQLHTINSKGESVFIDRSLEENKNLPMFKNSK